MTNIPQQETPLDSLTDPQLLAQFTTHQDHQAFAQLVHRHLNLVYAAARRQVGPAADDAAQAVFLLLAQKPPRLRTPTLAPWLYSVTAYCCKNIQRQQRSRRHHEKAAAMQTPLHTPQSQPTPDLKDQLDAALQRLSRPDRAAILLHFLQEKTFAQTAQSLGISEEAARKRTARALQKLRLHLSPQPPTLPTLTALLTTQATLKAPTLLLTTTLTLSHTTAATTILTLTKATTKVLWWAHLKTISAIVISAIIAISLATAGILATRAPEKTTTPTATSLPVAVASQIPTASSTPPSSQPQPPLTAAPTYTGTVLDNQNLPVHYAWVYLPPQLPSHGRTTDAAGHFTIPNPPTDPQIYLIWSQHARAMAIAKISSGQPPVEAHLNLKEGHAAGRILDSRGFGIPNLNPELILEFPDHTTLHLHTDKTNADGDYTFDTIPLGENMQAHIQLPNNADPQQIPSTPTITLTVSQRRIDFPDLTLPGSSGKHAPRPRQFISGLVIDEKQQPVADVELDVTYQADPGFAGVAWTTTNSSGHWNIRLPANAHEVLNLCLWHPDYISWSQTLALPPPPSTLLDGSAVSVLKRGIRIHGIVNDPTGKPVANVLVTSGVQPSTTAGPENAMIEMSSVGRTDLQGHFSIGGLPDKEVELNVNSALYAPSTKRITPQKDQTVFITLAPGLQCTGRTVDDDGSPVANATVSCYGWRTASLPIPTKITRFTQTDKDGRFILSALPPDGDVLLIIHAPEHLSTCITRHAGITTLPDTTLYLPCSISATVTDKETNAPITKFHITQGMFDGKTYDWLETQRDINDPEGKFSQLLDRFAIRAESHDDQFALKIEAPRYDPAILGPVKLGQDLENQTVKLTRKK